MAHWHGLAKLRMHSDLTLDIMDQVTSAVGQQFREFKATVCSAYHMHELPREVEARTRRLAKQTAKQKGKKGKQTSPLLEQGEAVESGNAIKNARRQKEFNFQTYKFHALGDYVFTIRQYGTVDSYSTEPVRAITFNSRLDLLTSLG
jgi:hypothetical protein